MNVTRSFSLGIDTAEGIRNLSLELGKKQNEIIKEAFALYLKSLDSVEISDRELAIESQQISEAFKRGEFKAISFRAIKAAHDAELAKKTAL
jgi:predicted DNA-binding protein